MNKIQVTILILLFCLMGKTSIAQIDSILFHDGQMESQWGSSTINDEFGCFVRFTPSYYPAKLVGIRAYFRNTGNPSEFKWKVYSDPTGQANGPTISMYESPLPFNNPAAGGFPNVDYSDYVDLTSANILLSSGDYYAGVVQSTGYFGIGIDNAPNNSVAVDRQWQWMTVFGNDYWNTLASQASSGQFGITAFFTPVSTSIQEVQENLQAIYFPEEYLVQIVFPNEMTKVEIQLFDISGRLSKSVYCSGSVCELDVSDLRPGIYTLRGLCYNKILTRKIEIY